MTLEEAQEEVTVIAALRAVDLDKAAAYLQRILSEAYSSGWDAAFDTAPDNFKPARRRFTLERAR